MARNPLSPYRSGGLSSDYGDPFLSLHREMNRLFDDVFRGGFGGRQNELGGRGEAIMPNIDVSERENEVRICAELPGVKQEDVEVTLSEDVLTIRGEKKFERKDEKENYHFMERSYGTFQRSLRIPYSIDSDQVKAEFDNGVLTVTLPKAPQLERSRRIQVAGRSQEGTEEGPSGWPKKPKPTK
jgi:HSP20 family protein